MEETEKSDDTPDEEEASEEASAKPKQPALISEANTAAERLEKANEAMEKLLNRQEEVLAEGRLQGKALAGQVPKKVEQTDEEYAADVLAGKVDLFGNEGEK